MHDGPGFPAPLKPPPPADSPGSTCWGDWGICLRLHVFLGDLSGAWSPHVELTERTKVSEKISPRALIVYFHFPVLRHCSGDRQHAQIRPPPKARPLAPGRRRRWTLSQECTGYVCGVSDISSQESKLTIYPPAVSPCFRHGQRLQQPL